MKLDNRTKGLIAIGSSVAANCESCLQYHINKAQKDSTDDESIKQAIEIGNMVKKGAASNMDKFIVELIGSKSPSEGNKGCDCSL